MIITNIRTNLSKIVDMENDSFSTHELAGIYKFYDNHKDFSVTIDGEVQ